MTITNASTHFKYPMNRNFMEYLDKLVVVLFGDLLAYPKTEEEPFSWLGNI